MNKIKHDSKSEWYLRGQMWTYEHILESEYWQKLPANIDKAELEKVLRDAWGAEKAFAKNNGAWFAVFQSGDFGIKRGLSCRSVFYYDFSHHSRHGTAGYRCIRAGRFCRRPHAN